jgi:hypothetical protein
VATTHQTRVVHGPFYRKVAPEVQGAATIVRQVLSGEVWGRAPRYGGAPQAKAYRGELPAPEQGFEFWSFQSPDNNYGPHAIWHKRGDFLVVDGNLGLVKLKIAFVRITQSLHALAP